MNGLLSPLWAQGNTRVLFEWGRIQSNADWILPVVALVASLAFVIWLYRRDAVELSRGAAWLLTFLRCAVFAVLLVIYLQPQRRIEEEKTINSRAAVMVDTSLSMGLTDLDQPAMGSGSTRIQQIADALRQSSLLQRLRKTHDVVVVPFDEELHRDRMLTLPKLPLQSTETAATAEALAQTSTGSDRQDSAAGIDWTRPLALAGEETRLSHAVSQLLSDEGNAPLSGVILLSDGQQNAGPGPETAIEAAKQAKTPLLTLGVGSDKQPSNARVAAFNPPPRAYPGDPYSASGVIQGWGMAGEVVTVQLLSRKGSADKPADRGTGDLIDSQQVTLGADGEETPVKFQITPKDVGRETLSLKLLPPATDRDPSDNLLEADIEIVDHKNHVLLMAGGPSREYQFVRNQLYRDKSTSSDVWLQTAKPGASQEAAKILDEFPSTRDQMFNYDCVIAFDPDWQALDQTQVDLLESWVAEQGGGLIVVAGPVFTGKQPNGWVQDPALSKIRALYPVEFPRRISAIESSTYESKDPWPLDFTRDGLEADFLELTDSAVESRQAWAGFPGVYGYFPVRGPKQGATVLARFSDPRTSQSGEQPVFMAWQFYGSGRVFYLGSGELWRLRSIDDTYYDRLWTKLIRHASKGRLLRGSTRGVLLVGQERYRLGNTVNVQAYRLTNARLEALQAPSVMLQVVGPDQTVQNISLRPDPSRAGSYLGQFPVLQQGDYRLELPLPDGDEERLTHRIHVEIPNLEREHPQRNDALLSELAADTGGKYFVGLRSLVDEADAIAGLLKDKTKTIVLTATPSRDWEKQWLLWAMLALFGLLCIEWTCRRLYKLA